MPSLILLAAGVGKRAGIKKQFIKFKDIPLYAFTLRKVADLFSEIIMTVPQDVEPNILYDAHKFGARFIYGGKERQDSVRFALEMVKDDIVVIHDSARPFASREVFKKVMDLENYDGKIAAAKARDTIKKLENGILKTIQRDNVWLAQTPQCFKTDVIKYCHEKAIEDGIKATDDAYLLECYGYSVGIVESSYWNIKLTYPEDIPFFDKILQR
ncbi:2-C-methyl-D-erythritol 4-phosphate cytidylyltransferase [Hydrogenobaculum acidophilum]